ncbi:hypothetical protein TNCV_4273711 [Trichonephila clavipes]|nr:hypothetical protein TNCV_4273711 [Trichonephila clavipes]
MSRADENISIYERKILRFVVGVKFRKMERGEEDPILSSINPLKNLTSLTSSKYYELNEQCDVAEQHERITGAVNNVDNTILSEVLQELNYRIDVWRVTKVFTYRTPVVVLSQ